MLDMNMNTNTDEDLRDEKEYLKTNLEICFNLISQNKDIFKNKDTFLEEFSPWHQEGKGKELIKDFEKQVANDTSEDFSWLNILKEDNQWKEAEYKEEIKDKSKYVNIFIFGHTAWSGLFWRVISWSYINWLAPKAAANIIVNAVSSYAFKLVQPS